MEFIDTLDKKASSRVLRMVTVLENDGPFMKPPYVKKIESKLYELRVKGRESIRIFYTVKAGEYYLLHAIKKKSQKLPQREVQTAVDRAREII